MKEMTKDDVEVVKHYLDKANHAVGHAFEAASQAFDIRCENEIDAAIEALTMAKGRLNDIETDFVGLVGELREKQREYFTTRSTLVLFECKALEKRVDDIVAKFAAEKK